MNKLSAECIGNYVSKNGNVVFRYKVTGSAEAMSAYEDAQGEYYTVDDATGNVLWFTTRFAGDKATLVVTDAGKIYGYVRVPQAGEFSQAIWWQPWSGVGKSGR